MEIVFVVFDLEYRESIVRGINEYNGQYFWECHETLEDPWMEMLGDPYRDVIWAIIQVGTALFHYQNENLAGAKGMLSKGKEKIKRSDASHLDTQFLNEKLAWSTFVELVFKIPVEPKLSDFEELIEFKFPPPEKIFEE